MKVEVNMTQGHKKLAAVVFLINWQIIQMIKNKSNK